MRIPLFARVMLTYLFILLSISMTLSVLVVWYSASLQETGAAATGAVDECVTFTLPPVPPVPNQDPIINDKRQCYLVGGGSVILIVGLSVTESLLGDGNYLAQTQQQQLQQELGHIRNRFGCWDEDQISISTMASSSLDDESISTRIEITDPELAALQGAVCEERFNGIPLTICKKGVPCPTAEPSLSSSLSASLQGDLCSSGSSSSDEVVCAAAAASLEEDEETENQDTSDDDLDADERPTGSLQPLQASEVIIGDAAVTWSVMATHAQFDSLAGRPFEKDEIIIGKED